MDPRFLRYYERELKHARDMGGEFARDFPKIAGRLGLDGFECADPYTERLFEALAFLAARVQLKIDAEFPAFTQHMLDLLYPGYLAPTPSMAVVQLKPNSRFSAGAKGVRVARGTSLRGRPLGQGTACEYRTGHDVNLWPIDIVSADYSTVVADFIDLERTGAPRAKAALRIVLRTTNGTPFSSLELDSLPIFVRGGDSTAARVYEMLLATNVGMVVQGADRPPSFRHVVSERCVFPYGFDDDQALLPCGTRAFHGHRLLHEYFAFAERFMFAEVRQLKAALQRCRADRVEIIVLLGRADPRLDGVVKAQQLALFCTPAVNLFPRSSDRIHVNEREHEYQITPDRTRPLDLEIHSVTQVFGYGVRNNAQREFLPLYAINASAASSSDTGFYTIRRQPRMTSARERARGTRSSYVGSETFISLVDGTQGAPDLAGLRQLGVNTLCTNRDLPLHLSIGQGDFDFSAESGAPVDAIRCIAGPTPPRNSPVFGAFAWRLVSHLGLDYLSLMHADPREGGAAIRELLALYADLGDPATVKQIQGILAAETKAVVRPLPVSGPLTFGRGTEVTLSCDETAFEGTGVFLLASVLGRFFAKYASINAFTETVLRTLQRGEIMRWPTTQGRRPSL